MDDDTSGEVQDAPFGEDAAAPDHVAEGEIDAEQPDNKEEQVCREANAIGEGTGDQCRCNDCEHHLVHEERIERDVRITRERVRQVDAVQEHQIEVADDPPDVRTLRQRPAEAHRIADGEPDHRGYTQGNKALDHDCQNIFPTDQTAIEKSEPRRHQHDEAGTDQHEAGIAGVEIGHTTPPERNHGWNRRAQYEGIRSNMILEIS